MRMESQTREGGGDGEDVDVDLWNGGEGENVRWVKGDGKMNKGSGGRWDEQELVDEMERMQCVRKRKWKNSETKAKMTKVGSDGAAKEAKEEKGESAGKVEDEQRKGHIVLQIRKSNRMIEGK